MASKKQPKKKLTPTSGQSGPIMKDLKLSDLNPKERRVLVAMNGEGTGKRVEMGIPDLATSCWKNKSKFQSNSWVRNSLRRLVRAKMIDKLARGAYRISDGARKQLAKTAVTAKAA